MKKFILSAVAVAAFSIGGVAQADIIDGVGNAISRIFNIPYDPTPGGVATTRNVYTDSYGRRFQVDPSGRLVPLHQYGSYRDQWGRTVHLGANGQPAYIEQNGQLIPYHTTVMGASSRDYDGDGVSDRYDRAPDDPRYR